MTEGEALVLGKAMLWFAAPMLLAVWELWRLRVERRRDDHED